MKPAVPGLIVRRTRTVVPKSCPVSTSGRTAGPADAGGLSVAARDALRAAGAYTGESDHGATKSVYGADPDGIEFELMVLLPHDQWGKYEHAAPVMRLNWDKEIQRG